MVRRELCCVGGGEKGEGREPALRSTTEQQQSTQQQQQSTPLSYPTTTLLHTPPRFNAMGKTTKSGKTLNPTDAFRKEQRKKEIKKVTGG